MSALIVTALLGDEDFAWLDALRLRHYPPERNRVPAHLTLFQGLPPSAEAEIRHQLSLTAKGPPPRAELSGILDLGTGTAFRIASDDLDRIRDELADHFHGLLSAADRGGWIPHVTVQNKVDRRAARALAMGLERDFRPRPLRIAGLSLERYLGGPWERLGAWKFRAV